MTNKTKSASDTWTASDWSDFKDAASRHGGGWICEYRRHVGKTENPWWLNLAWFLGRRAAQANCLYRILHPASGWCQWDDNWDWARFSLWRLFYTLKASLCAVFLYWRGPGDNWYRDVEIAVYDIREAVGEYSGQDWEEISVGLGVFKNWWIREYWNSSY